MSNIKFTLIFLLLLTKIVSAQSIDLKVASIKYKVVYTANNTVLVNDICQLDITNQQSYFYSLGVKEAVRKFAIKAEQAAASNTRVAMSEEDLLHNMFKFNTIKEYNSNRSIVLEFVGDETLGYVKDTLSNMKWEITQEVRMIDKLKCRLAKYKSGKVTVSAWFCPDIPFRDGPLFYYGLPGLIVKLENSQGWSVDLLSVSYSGIIKEQIAIEPYRLVTNAQFKRAKKIQDAMLENGKISGGSFEKANQ